jgi:hypothetical protein
MEKIPLRVKLTSDETDTSPFTGYDLKPVYLKEGEPGWYLSHEELHTAARHEDGRMIPFGCQSTEQFLSGSQYFALAE